MKTKKKDCHTLENENFNICEWFNTTIVVYCLLLTQCLVFLFFLLSFFDVKFDDSDLLLETVDISFKIEDQFAVEIDTFKDYDNHNLGENFNSCTYINDSEKFNCFPEKGRNKKLCEKRGCCWNPRDSDPIPQCYYPQNYNGYRFVNKTITKHGLRIFLKRKFPSPYPKDIQLLKMDIQYLSSSIIHIKISDANSNRYEPPYPDIPVLHARDKKEHLYNVKFSQGFKVVRNDGNLIFDCDNVGGFIFADQFLQISAKFQGKIYGLGEHQSTLQLSTNWTKFTMFNHDGVPLPNANLYGSHPFYMVLEPNGKSHGVFLHNSNAMEVSLQPLPAVTFRAIGGIFDFYFFLGPTPADVIKQYTSIIGRPFLPPYWSLGFHLSRLGYKNTEHLRQVWNRTREAKIPFVNILYCFTNNIEKIIELLDMIHDFAAERKELVYATDNYNDDTQWHDIDYMNNRNDFTYDKRNYLKLPEFISEIHNAGMRYVPILDPGISGCEPNGTYHPYDDGVLADAFIKNNNGSIFVAKVWNSKCTVFPDFTSPNTVLYWANEILQFYRQIAFDGLWIDMNEPANFLDGSFDGCPRTEWDNPVYLPDVVGGKLYHKTVCMSAKQFHGVHYNLHNLYGFSEAIATNRALRQLGKRPFIISRATYPGSGAQAGHWSGDVVSTWHAMKASIPQLLSFSLFGIPMMGADICGFNGNTTVRLCQRWSQLGAFYPFSRNHNTDDAIDQDPAALGDDNVKSTRKALMIRYTLLPYLYTLFFRAHTKGETVARPLFFEFSSDPRTHSLDESYLWGSGLLIVPVLTENATIVKTYLPRSRWYDWYTLLGIESNGTDIDVHAPLDIIPIFIRGGYIIPTQKPDITTSLSRYNKMELLVACNSTFFATGSFYWDDGESLNSLEAHKYGYVEFILTPHNLTSNVIWWDYHEAPILSSIKILGFVKPVRVLLFNNEKVKFKWDKVSLVLSVEVNHPIHLLFSLIWK